MNSEVDMDAPVTHRELREELQQLEQSLEQRLEQKIEQKLRETERRLEQSLDAKIDSKLAHWANAIMEHQRSLIGALDDKYASIPARTAALEDAVAELTPRVAVLERKVFVPAKRQTGKRAARRRSR